MLKCTKAVNVRAEHFKVTPKDKLTYVREGEMIEVKKASIQPLVSKGYFEVVKEIKTEDNELKDSQETG